MYIIVKKTPSSMRFAPHFNRSLGHYVHTKDDYLKSMKAKGMEPMTTSENTPNRKEYKQSAWAKDVVKAVKSQTDSKGNFKPSGSLMKELNKTGVTKPLHKHAPLNVSTDKGGFQ